VLRIFLKANLLNQIIIMRKIQIIFIYLFVLLLSPLSAQNFPIGKIYNSDLDSLWSNNVYIYDLSSNGKWAVFGEVYNDNTRNTTTIINTSTNDKYVLEYSEDFKFSNNNKWIALRTLNNELTLIDLDKREKSKFQNISSFEFNKYGTYLVIQQKLENNQNALFIINLINNKKVELKNIADYKWNPEEDILLINSIKKDSSQVILYRPSDSQERTIHEDSIDSTYSHFLWDSSGQSVFFVERKDENIQFHYYDILNDNHKFLNNKSLEKRFPGSMISDKEYIFSDNGELVYFYRNEKKSQDGYNQPMEIWDTSEAWIYPKMKSYTQREKYLMLTVWNTKTNNLMAIEDNETPSALFNPEFTHAIVYSKLTYEPQYKENVDVDLYLKNIETGEKQLIVQKQYLNKGRIQFSPSGRYITYFKNDNWWVYDTKKNQSVDLTSGIDISFKNINGLWTKDAEPFGNPGWTENEQYIVLYDEYDIWLIQPNGTKKKKITSGRKKGIKYRIVQNNAQLQSLKYSTSAKYDITKGFILKSNYDDLKEGYSIWNEEKQIELFNDNQKSGDVIYSNDQNTMILKKERFNDPPGIYVLNLKKQKIKLLYQSNQSLLKYDLGQDRIIYYNVKGKILKGILIYPAQFDPNKKYPMVTWIYERMARTKAFDSPADFGTTGFNILKYSTNGYFVLLPDIEYQIQEPGVSALNCVVEAVGKALKLEPSINAKKVGLIGHSFGGYEAAFIATQTSIFAAIVAGAPVTDLVSWYHDISWDWETEQMYRTESQQFRMGDSYYNLKEKYQQNSPLNYIENLNTPLLLWTGKLDTNINWQQSVYMFMAMKRLNKNGKLLLFNGESHNIINMENQKALFNEVSKWFDNYLK